MSHHVPGAAEGNSVEEEEEEEEGVATDMEQQVSGIWRRGDERVGGRERGREGGRGGREGRGGQVEEYLFNQGHNYYCPWFNATLIKIPFNTGSMKF